MTAKPRVAPRSYPIAARLAWPSGDIGYLVRGRATPQSAASGLVAVPVPRSHGGGTLPPKVGTRGWFCVNRGSLGLPVEPMVEPLPPGPVLSPKVLGPVVPVEPVVGPIVPVVPAPVLLAVPAAPPEVCACASEIIAVEAHRAQASSHDRIERL